MKRVIVVIVVLLFVLFRSSPVLGLSLETEVRPKAAEVLQYDTAVFELEIGNNQDVTDRFLVLVRGPHLEWKMPGDILLVVEPGQKKKTKLSFYPTESGLYTYTVTVKSFSFPSVVSTEKMTLDVKPRSLMVRDFRAEVEGDDIFLTLDVKASEEARLVMDFTVKRDEDVIKTITTTQRVMGAESFKKAIYIGDFKAGVYSVEARIQGSVEKDEFTIEPVHRIVEEKEIIHGFLYDEIVVSVKNMGNVEEDYQVTGSMQKNLLAGFVTKPTRCFTGQDQRICNFELEGIQPKSTAQVVYRVEYWPTISQIFGIIAVVLVLGTLSYGEMMKPRIRKRHFGRKGKEHHIILEVKNPHKTARNVIVRDFVSPLADVVHKFEHMKPIVKKSEAGTELIWKIGQMKPREERVLNYKVKPLVEGNLKMPKAYLRYKPKEGKRARVYSRHLVVNAM